MQSLDVVQLLEAITKAQHSYIADAEPRILFDNMLNDLLQLADAEYGFIGEVHFETDGHPYLKTHAITNISWDEATRRFYEENAPAGLEFRRLESLFGAVLTSGHAVISNAPATDPRRGGLPEGHPPLNAFLGAPFFHGGEMVGMVGIANRPGGFDEHVLEYLQPFLTTCAGIIASRHAREMEQARHAQKMQAIGNLTAGVAHNFNNILMGILPALDLLRDVVPESHMSLLDGASTSAERARDLVRKLMVFARKSMTHSERTPQDVVALVDRTVERCGETFERNITIDVGVEPDLPPVLCDPKELEQVLMNLLLNARDAVGETALLQPRITVQVGTATQAHVPTSLPRNEAGYVAIRVIDDGPGMTEEVSQQAFEPFFTTKDVGKGTGLGLATSFAIMQDHHGHIQVDSQPGVGTTLTLLLPATSEKVQEVAAKVAPTGPRVLVVDDEPAVRETVRFALESAGFENLAAPDGETALELLYDHDVDVVLLDRAMPGIPGAALVPDIRALAPQALILYFTGEDASDTGDADGVILKPVSRVELIEALTEAMESDRAPID